MSSTASGIRPSVTTPPAPARIPTLCNGDHLPRAEFHRRYAAMDPGTSAELIEGIVFLWRTPGRTEPVSVDEARPRLEAAAWLGLYVSRTSGLMVGMNCSVFLDGDNEPQPEVFLGIPTKVGGRTKLIWHNGKDYIDGAPDLVVEVSASTASIDLNSKLAAYQRNGVGEYLVVLTEDEREVRWMSLVDNRFVPIEPDPADGLLKSTLFPGLWLDPAALLAGDLPKLLAAVERGCATDAHSAFVARLAGK